MKGSTGFRGFPSFPFFSAEGVADRLGSAPRGLLGAGMGVAKGQPFLWGPDVAAEPLRRQHAAGTLLPPVEQLHPTLPSSPVGDADPTHDPVSHSF